MLLIFEKCKDFEKVFPRIMCFGLHVYIPPIWKTLHFTIFKRLFWKIKSNKFYVHTLSLSVKSFSWTTQFLEKPWYPLNYVKNIFHTLPDFTPSKLLWWKYSISSHHGISVYCLTSTQHAPTHHPTKQSRAIEISLFLRCSVNKTEYFLNENTLEICVF